MNQDDNTRTFTLYPGQIVKISGIPFRLETEAKVSGHERNVDLVFKGEEKETA